MIILLKGWGVVKYILCFYAIEGLIGLRQMPDTDDEVMCTYGTGGNVHQNEGSADRS